MLMNLDNASGEDPISVVSVDFKTVLVVASVGGIFFFNFTT